MIRTSLLIAGVLAIPTSAFADYEPLGFANLAGTSEAILVGAITEVNEETFTVEVKDAIVGPHMPGATLIAQRFRDWPCAWRWAEYEAGQVVLLFLDASDDGRQWISRGAACEGESPVVDGEVHCNFGLPARRVPYDNGRFRQGTHLAVSYEQLRAAIVDFRESYRITRAANPWRKDGEYSVHVPFSRIERIVAPRTSPFPTRRPPPEFANRSALHRYLAEDLDREREKMAKYNPD